MGKTVKTALAVLCLALLLSACGEKPMPAAYTQISAQEAYEMMDGAAVILDVREREEYDAGHIPGALLLPVGTVSGDSAAAVIPGKDTVVLVYCRSGNRSKVASDALVQLGYTQVYEFGGIRDWPYEVVTD